MNDIHIDDFYKDMAKILVLLYGHFPRRTILYVDDISGPDTPDEFGLHHPRYQACFQTMLWLANTGYIEFAQTIQQDALDQAVLSHRAFLLLNSPVPDGLGAEAGASPLAAAPEAGLQALAIHRLKQELASGTSFSLAALMKQLMKQSRQLS